MVIIFLSSFSDHNCIVIRDGFFDNLRKVSDAVDGKPLTFIESEKYLDQLINKQAGFSCVIVANELLDRMKFFTGGIAASSLPKAVFLSIHNKLPIDSRLALQTTIGTNAIISDSAYISKTGVIIGNNVTIEDNVRIYPGVEIGNNVKIRYGSLLGCTDYERCLDSRNCFISVEHKGWVRISDCVQIDEYVIIDRPLFDWDFTSISENTYIGKKVYISHGSKIGACVFVAPCASICGNTIIEDRARIGIGSIIGSRIVIGAGSIVSIGSVVNKSVLPNERVTGNLAIPHKPFMQHLKGMLQE